MPRPLIYSRMVVIRVSHDDPIIVSNTTEALAIEIEDTISEIQKPPLGAFAGKPKLEVFTIGPVFGVPQPKRENYH